MLGPNLAALSLGWSGTLNGYLDPYMKQDRQKDRQKYTITDLRIDTQSAWGKLPRGILSPRYGRKVVIPAESPL